MAKFIPPDKLPYDLTMVDRVKFAEMLADRDGPTVDRRMRIGLALTNPEFVGRLYQLYEIKERSTAVSGRIFSQNPQDRGETEPD